eukprot:Rmarinus@m.26670
MRAGSLVLALSCIVIFQKGSAELEDWEKELILGDVEFELSTGSPEVQERFILGLKLLQCFWYDLAISEFQLCQKEDPTFAMAYWGESLCYKNWLWNSENVEAGRQVLERLAMQAYEVSSREQLYLDSVEVLWGNGTGQQRNECYAKTLKTLSETYPEDLSGVSFYALSLLELTNATHIDEAHQTPGVTMSALSDELPENPLTKARDLIEEVLAEDPEHPAALHYALHAYDFPERWVAYMGLPAAERYPTIVKDASHGDHMPSHIYLRLGHFKEATEADYMALEAGDGFADQHMGGNYSYDAENRYHSVEYLQYYLFQLARYEEARTHRNRLADIVAVDDGLEYKQWYYRMVARQFLEPLMDPVDSVFKPERLEEDPFWSSISEAALWEAYIFSLLTGGTSLDPFISSEIDEASARLLEIAESVSEWDYNKRAVEVMRLEMLALNEFKLFRYYEGLDTDLSLTHRNQAFSYMDEAVATEDEAVLLPISPTILFLPSWEFYGSLIVDCEYEPMYDYAAGLFTKSLAVRPSRAASLLGLGRVEHLRGREATSHEVYALLDEQWSDADTDFEALNEVRYYGAESSSNEANRVYFGIVMAIVVLATLLLVLYLTRSAPTHRVLRKADGTPYAPFDQA